MHTIKVTIPRDKWLRGEGMGKGRYTDGCGARCAMGWVLHTLGVDEAVLEAYSEPIGGNPDNHKPVIDFGDPRLPEVAAQWVYKMREQEGCKGEITNDMELAGDSADELREFSLIALFHDLGVDLEFV